MPSPVEPISAADRAPHSRRLRVLFAIGSLGGGGSEKQLIGILRTLDRTRFEPHLYLVHRSGEFLEQVPSDVPITAFDDDVPQATSSLPGGIHRQQVAHLAGHLRGENAAGEGRGQEGAFDVLYDRTPHMTLITAPAARRAKVPRISTIVVDPARDVAENLGRFSIIKRRLLTRAYRGGAWTIANSQSLLTAAINYYGLSRERSLCISNGFDFDRLAALSAEPCPFQLDPAGTHLVAAGRLQPQKGFDVLIEAMHRLQSDPGFPSVHLWLAGKGPDEAALRSRIGRHGLADRIHLPGFLSNPYPLISKASLFCLTSRYEGMPNILVEAMACGVPVLASDCPHGPREILEDGQLGWLVPTNHGETSPDVLADHIRMAIRSLPSVSDRTRAARQSVMDRYSLEAGVRKLEDVLASAAKTPQRHS